MRASIEAICRSKLGETFILVAVPLNDLEGSKFEGGIFVYKVCNIIPRLHAILMRLLVERGTFPVGSPSGVAFLLLRSLTLFTIFFPLGGSQRTV